MSIALLDVQNLSLSFGGLKAVQNFSLQLHTGDLQGLIGPNGAGKTTVFNLLTGVYQPLAGTFKLDGRPLNGLRPYQIAAAGISRTFQNIRLFQNLTVLDNVRIACHLRIKSGMHSAVAGTICHRSTEKAIIERSEELLGVFNLLDRKYEYARNLPYGDQRQLEIARALATNPRVLLLDEPAAGMNSNEKVTLRELIRSIRDRFGVSILMIEHDMGVVMGICEKITVLDYGQIIASGPPEQIQKDPKVIEAYLGTPTELPAEARV